DRFGALERGARPVEEAEEEVVLGARRGVLQAAQDLLVGDRGRAGGGRGFRDNIVDLAKKREGRRFALGEPVERLDATDQLRMRRRERGRLAGGGPGLAGGGGGRQGGPPR